MVESRSLKKTNNKEDHRKFYSRFLFKALILAVLCAIVPVFLSQTPELANQTRLLELLHLVFVGIAVSYGLFSRRNSNGGGSNDHKPDHNYVPKILEVSSVFNVGQESESEPSDGDYSKIQTWRNKHHLNVSEIVVSRDNQTRFVDRVSSENREKPLLLPVRSLNHSRVSDSNDHTDRWEKVRSKRQLLKSLGDDHIHSDVLPSPIPWSSRSSSSSSSSQPLIKIPTNSTSSDHVSSPRKSTPLPEFVPKTEEDIGRRHNFHCEFHQPPSPPPPPPPPPPLPAFYNSPLRKDRYRIESAQKTKLGDREFHPPPPPPPPPPTDYYKSSPAKLRVSSERRKSSDQKTSSKRNSTKKVWWSDPVVESKEPIIIRQETEKDSYLGSKLEESEDIQERRRRDNDDYEKKIEEEGVCGSNSGSDVDKKADEFIAKFREQIRLQRIESIKRSATKISSANSSSR